MTSDKKTFVVIPTYNERDNLVTIVEQILALNLSNLCIIIVDDNSPDGTGGVADELSHKHSNLHVIHRPAKIGLGPAYVDGFKYALDQAADYIFEIDADLSHDPRLIPTFLESIEHYDLILGSRYIDKGGINNWNIVRRFVSWGGNLFSRLILSVPIKDMTGGFKCYRRKVLESIDINNLNSMGYVFQIETTYKAYNAGFKIKELPIIFTERREGESKFNVGIFVGAFFKVLMLRFKK
jgi:dolichol-phosphate mannosyltransferase